MWKVIVLNGVLMHVYCSFVISCIGCFRHGCGLSYVLYFYLLLLYAFFMIWKSYMSFYFKDFIFISNYDLMDWTILIIF
jgi:hypothetical protein